MSKFARSQFHLSSFESISTFFSFRERSQLTGTGQTRLRHWRRNGNIAYIKCNYILQSRRAATHGPRHVFGTVADEGCTVACTVLQNSVPEENTVTLRLPRLFFCAVLYRVHPKSCHGTCFMPTKYFHDGVFALPGSRLT
jgi:hypothetical protein